MAPYLHAFKPTSSLVLARQKLKAKIIYTRKEGTKKTVGVLA